MPQSVGLRPVLADIETELKAVLAAACAEAIGAVETEGAVDLAGTSLGLRAAARAARPHRGGWPRGGGRSWAVAGVVVAVGLGLVLSVALAVAAFTGPHSPSGGAVPAEFSGGPPYPDVVGRRSDEAPDFLPGERPAAVYVVGDGMGDGMAGGVVGGTASRFLAWLEDGEVCVWLGEGWRVRRCHHEDAITDAGVWWPGGAVVDPIGGEVQIGIARDDVRAVSASRGGDEATVVPAVAVPGARYRVFFAIRRSLSDEPWTFTALDAKGLAVQQ